MTDSSSLNVISPMYLRFRHALLLICLSALFSSIQGCAPPKPHPAVIAYQRLIGAFGSGDPAKIWSLLSNETRSLLARRLNQTDPKPLLKSQDSTREALSIDTPPTNFQVELNWTFESPFTARPTLEPLSQNAETSSKKSPRRFREVRVFYASQSWLIPVILEEGTWRVHLLGAHSTPAVTSIAPHR